MAVQCGPVRNAFNIHWIAPATADGTIISTVVIWATQSTAHIVVPASTAAVHPSCGWAHGEASGGSGLCYAEHYSWLPAKVTPGSLEGLTYMR